MAAAKLIASKYAGKCRTCKRSHDAGNAVYWTPGVKGVECRACFAAGGPAPAPSPTPVPAPAPTVAPEAPVAPTEVVGARTVREWQSWHEFVEYAREHANAREYSHNRERSGGWFKSASFDDAVKLAENGWAEVRPQVDALVEKIDASVAPMMKPAFESYFDVSGGGVDVGRFLAGEPECMVETKLVNIAKPGRVVTILVDGFYSDGIDADDIIARGVAIVALVDSLERMQHGTEIWYETSFRPGRNKKELTYLVKVKGAEDLLDIDLLMFVLAHPSAYRRINFAAQERAGENKSFHVGPGNNYGTPGGLHMGDRVNASIQLPRLVWGDETANGTVWVEKVLSEFGLMREDGE